MMRFMAAALAAAVVFSGAALAATPPDVSPDHPFATEIGWMVDEGLTQGYDDGTFRPQATLSRQAFAAFLYRWLDGADAKPVCVEDGFRDVAVDHPFCGEIAWLADHGIVQGYDDGTFKPARAISRQAMAALMYRLAQAEGATVSTHCDDAAFPDVSSGHAFCEEMTWLRATGITTGYADCTYRPSNPVTRQAMAAYLYRYVHGAVEPEPCIPQVTYANCPVFPPDNYWNTDISDLPVHSRSDAWVASIGNNRNLHPDFGTFYQGAPIGIPITTVGAGQAKVPVSFYYASESDPGPYPIPPSAKIEGGPNATGDRHVLVVDSSTCTLYELFDAWPKNGGARWEAGSGAIFNLRSNALRPAGWTSADAAGLPIMPGLVRYDEVMAGEINHALRFTVSPSQNAYLWPARHAASTNSNPNVPPMGARFRLKDSYDCSSYSSEAQVVCAALKTYGMVVADNGSNWFISGEHDPRWSDARLGDIKRIPGSAFEAVDTSSLR